MDVDAYIGDNRLDSPCTRHPLPSWTSSEMKSPSIVKPLERPLAAFSSNIDSARDVAVAGLRWSTPYWCDLAIGWLEQGLVVDVEIDEILRDISQSRRYPQSLRHRAFALHVNFARNRVVE
jgi:hypothetical protein